MRRFSQPQYPWPQELHDSRGAVLLRAGAVAPPFSVRRNRLMPFRAPALAQVSRPRPRLHPTAAKYRRNRGRRQHEVQPLRQRGIGKTSTDKTSTRRPPENISKTSRRRHENHRQRRGCAGETRALAARGDRWSLALRRSAAHEPPAAREPPQQASLLEHEGHQRNAIYRANSAR